jgi:nucleoside-diphosphate-sugar epimerase
MAKALITGATGFIGGRLAEVLVGQGVPVVALVRTWSAAARISRLPLEMLPGDVLDLDSLRRALAGCGVVYHCAVDWRGGGRQNKLSSAQGTRNVLQAAADAGVARVVFLSTVGVFGRSPAKELVTEEDPTPHTGDDYGDGKIDAEREALEAHRTRGLPVAVLRPTIVYGPFSRSWTVSTAAAVREGRMVMVNGGGGVCNALYVDNLIEAMLLAARHPQAPGQVFHISDPVTVSWKTFIEAHARALGESYLPLPEMTVEEIARLRREVGQVRRSTVKESLRVLRDRQMREALLRIPVVGRMGGLARWMARTVVPHAMQRRLREYVVSATLSAPDEPGGTAGPSLPSRSLVEIYASRAVFSVEKARRVLGYAPAVDFDEGMRRTAEWIRWARL